MKKGIFLVMVLVFLVVLCANLAQAADMIGWRIVFTLNGQTAIVGASDYGSGYAVANQNFPGTHIGIGPDGGYESLIRYNAGAPLAETLVIWNEGLAPFSGTLSWEWQNYDQLWNSYIAGPKADGIAVKMNFVALDGSYIKLDPNGGSLPVGLVQNGNFGQPYRITICTEAVPEPSGIIALLSGITGITGFVLKRRA